MPDVFDAVKLDHFDNMDVFDILDDLAPDLDQKLKAMIEKEVASRVKWQMYKIVKEMPRPERVIETHIVREKMVAPPEKVIIKKEIDHEAMHKAVDKKIKKAMVHYEKNVGGPVVVPSPIPNQDGQGGKILSTNGRLTKWIVNSGGGGLPLTSFSANNVTTTRSYDATNTSLDEMANVLGSLIQTLTFGTGSTDAYSVSNVTTDRTYDATLTSLDELSNVLGSLIQSLQGIGVVQ